MKNVIITGTSRGIGLELVRAFSEMGHNVYALSRNMKPVSDLNLDGVKSISCDITSEDDLLNLKASLKKELINIDILINNAGAIKNKPFLETTISDFKEVYNTNLFGVVGLIQTVLPFMSNDGHIVNITSMGGIQGSVKFPGLSAYSSSKGAMITLTEMLAEEFKEGPSFNALALGAVQTEMLEEAFPGYKAPLQPVEMADYIAQFSLTGNKFYNGKVLQVSSSTP